MTASTFDALTAAIRLESAGFTREQAEAAGADRAELVTKGDFAELAQRAELVTRGEFYRALWIQSAGIVLINLAAIGFAASFILGPLAVTH